MRMKTTRDVDTIVSAVIDDVKLTSAGAISGGPGNPGRWGCGRLAQHYVESACAATYTLYSYSTPMAWRNPDGTWTMPLDKYSITTSRHQGVIRRAVRLLEATRSAVLDEALTLLGLPHTVAPSGVTVTLPSAPYAAESAQLDRIEQKLSAIKYVERQRAFLADKAERGDNIGGEATPYDKNGLWHSRSHP